MLRRPTQRMLAPFALALALLAALPCSVLAGEESCSAMVSPCSDANESPCAQLGAASCCEAPRIPLDKSFAPQIPTVAAADLEPMRTAICVGIPIGFDRRPPPPSLSGHLSIRDVILRL